MVDNAVTHSLKEYLSSFELLSDQEIETFIGIGKVKELKKGELFSREGEVVHQVAFVNTGLFRSFYYSSADEDVTFCFRFAKTFIGAYSSFLTGEPAQENFQAISDAEIIVFKKTDLEELQQQSINWVKFFKQLAELEYLALEKRVFLLQKESAETRYADLLQKHPEYLQHIPLNYLASYLGVTQRHLSRIRAKITI